MAIGFAVGSLCMIDRAVDAQDATWKIGVVNRKLAYDSYKKQVEETDRLEKKVETRQAGLDKMAEDIRKAREEFEQNADSMSSEDQDRARQRISADFAAYQAELKKIQTEIDGEHALLIKHFRQDIDAAVTKVGEQGNFHLILESDPKIQSVLYFSTSIDITPQVIALLNSGN